MADYKKADAFYRQAVQSSNQPDYDEAEETRLNQLALDGFKKLESKIPAARPFDSLSFFIKFKAGELEHYFDHPAEALKYYGQAISIKKSLPSLPDSLLFLPVLFSGIIHYTQNHFDTALYYLQWAEQVKSQYPNPLSDEERLYNNLGAIYYAIGNFRQAKNYFRKAIDVLPVKHPYYQDLLVTYYINLASAHTTLEEYDAANEIYQRILSYGVSTHLINHNIGIINLNLGAADKALAFFRKALQGNDRMVKLYNDMGSAHFNLKQYDSTRYYLDKAVKENQLRNPNNPNVAFGLTLKHLGDLEMALGHPYEALDHYQRALRQFYPGYPDFENYNEPAEFSGVFSYINLFRTLTAKADALHSLYVMKGNADWARYELNTYKLAFKLIDYVERSYDSDEARLFLNNMTYVVHNKPIDIAFQLYDRTGSKHYLEEAYFFDQKNKASVLAYNRELLSQRPNIDSTILKEERRLRTEITRLSLSAARIGDSLGIAVTSKAIRENEILLGRLQEKIAASVGEHFNTIPTVKHLQQNVLDEQGAIISFHLSEQSITIFQITKKELKVLQKPIGPQFTDQLRQMNGALTDPDKPWIDSICRKFYKMFFEEVDEEKVKRLILIPDDELNYLPFEALKDENNQYLLRKFTVQYQYATSLLKVEKRNLKNSTTLAFAPFTQQGFSDSISTFSRLPSSYGEVKNIKGISFVNAQATKEKLMENIAHYPIVHLATHAIVNRKQNDLSYIVFSPFDAKNRNDYLLYEQEIYNLPLQQTRLVILSACETGSGSLQKGEGVMSLSRAFTYAGCPDIITSLWKADDDATAYLTNRIHLYLDEGRSIDAATRQAKLDYLDDPSVHPRKKHPSYWAHLVYIGNYFRNENHNYWWLWVGGGMLVMFVIWRLFKKAVVHRKRMVA